MKPIPSIRTSMRRGQAGFSLVELLVVMLLSSMMLTLLTGFFRANAIVRHQMGLQTEAQQGLRATFEMISQELRQAGACLPRLGQFIALDGEDHESRDRLTLRIGRTDGDTLVCIRAGTTQAAEEGDSTLVVAAGEGDLFAGTTLVYITPNGASGNFYTVTATTSNSVSIDGGLIGDHPVGTGIYAVDERTYEVDISNPARPVLMVRIDGGAPQPLVEGVEQFDVRYLLAPCDASGCATTTDEPADDDEWRQVREVAITATVRSHKQDRQGRFLRESGYVHVKPRNLI
ncbi:MAG: PilW family protein [Candidatus Binatia bacterium]|nr:PilW family protein [Candidatus Binatia bacterium]